jgi:FlgD Ig-like domain
MKSNLLIFLAFISFCSQLISANIYFGPGQKYTEYNSAFQAAESGDQIIDCTNIDVKILPENHWNWISFPRLSKDKDGWAEATKVLEKFHDWPVYLDMIHNLDYFIQPNLEFSTIECWSPAEYYINSENSYKLKLSNRNRNDHILKIIDELLPADHKLDYELPAMSANWLGYWIPYSQNIEDAFGDQFDNVYAVEAEDWFYVNSTQYIFESKDVFVFDTSYLNTPSSSTVGKNFEYGKGYILYFLESVEGFQWNDSKQEAMIIDHPQPIHFKEKQSHSYNVIDILDIPEDVIEIGIYVEDECFAAKSVHNYKEQFLVYTSWDHRGETPYHFRILKQDLQVDTLQTVAVYNKKLGRFERNQLMAGKTKYSIIKLNAEDYSEAPVEQTEDLKIEILPRPQSAQTDIKIILAKDLEIELSVFDVNNVKIRQILTGNFGSGEHVFSWNGKDDSAKQCSSGVYYVVLKSDQHSVKKKILLLK